MEGPLSRLGSAMQVKAAFLLQFYNSQWGEWVAQGSYPYHPILSRRSTSWHLPGICLAGCTPRSSTESSWSGWGRGAHMTSFVAGMLSCVDFCAVLLSKLGEKPKISMFKGNAWHSGPGCLGEMG